MKRTIRPGIADYTALVFIPDAASTDGSGKTGLAAADLTVSYTRVETDNDVVVTDVTGSLNDITLTAAHTDWGFEEVSNTLAPGLYRLDIADAVFASGAWTAVVYVMVTTSAASASPMEFILSTTDMDAVYSDTTTIQSDTTSLASDLAEGDFSDILSRLTVSNSNILIIKSDTSDIKSHLVVIAAVTSDIQSDTNVMVPIISDIQSDTNKLVSDATEVDTSDILSLLTKVYSDTAHIDSDTTVIETAQASQFVVLEQNTSDTESALVKIYSDTTAIEGTVGGGEGDISDVLSRLVVTNSQLVVIKSDTAHIESDVVVIETAQASQFVVLEQNTSDTESALVKIYSDTTIIEAAQASQFVVLEQNTSDTESALVKVYSDTTAIEAGGGALTATQASQLARAQSDTIRILSDTTQIQSDTAHIESDAVRIESMAVVIKSDTSDVISALVKVYSDTTLATTATGTPAQGAPPNSATPQSKVDYLYAAWRNKTEQTASEYSLYDDAGTTKIVKATVSDDATTFTRDEVGTGA